MDLKQRFDFWNVLCSLDGKDVEKDSSKIREVIQLPRYLYRYREVNTKTLEALRTNKIYFSSANYYDDPFDTFLQIDLELIKREFESNFKSERNISKLVNAFKKSISSTQNNENVLEKASELTPQIINDLISNGVINNFFNYMGELRNEIKKDTWSVCFSENGFNETLWLKYANQHKGFALIYDLSDDSKLLCGKLDKCKNCGINNFGTPIYPMYYSNEKYDATNFAKYIFMKKMEEVTQHVMDLSPYYAELGNQIWEKERTTLIKRKCHEHDEEWRMITACDMQPPITREWIPSGIILGLKMETNEENLVVTLAETAGIEKIYKSFINAKGDLDAYDCKK